MCLMINSGTLTCIFSVSGGGYPVSPTVEAVGREAIVHITIDTEETLPKT